jgi:hypothetical protein
MNGGDYLGLLLVGCTVQADQDLGYIVVPAVEVALGDVEHLGNSLNQ